MARHTRVVTRLIALLLAAGALTGLSTPTHAAADKQLRSEWYACRLILSGSTITARTCHTYAITKPHTGQIVGRKVTRKVTGPNTGHSVNFPVWRQPVAAALPACYWPAVRVYSSAILGAARTYGIPAGVLAGLIEVESGGNPAVVSYAGAIGLTQLMPATAAYLGVNPWDPTQNIYGGAKYLRLMMSQYGFNLYIAVAAYNGGPGNPQYGYAQAVYGHVCS